MFTFIKNTDLYNAYFQDLEQNKDVLEQLFWDEKISQDQYESMLEVVEAKLSLINSNPEILTVVKVKEVQ